MPTQFDFDLIKIIAKIGEKKVKNMSYDKCGDPRFFNNRSESANKIGLFFMIIAHLFVAKICSKFEIFRVGFKGTFRSCQDWNTCEIFEANKWKYIGLNFVLWIVLGAGALGLNYKFGTTGQVANSNGKNFGKERNYCLQTKGKDDFSKIFWNSMINIWIVTDLTICLILMPCLVFKYYMDKALMNGNWIELLIHV